LLSDIVDEDTILRLERFGAPLRFQSSQAISAREVSKVMAIWQTYIDQADTFSERFFRI
jgi:hypothetical protein